MAVEAWRSYSFSMTDDGEPVRPAERLHDWQEAERAFEEFDRTGESLDAEAVLADSVARVEARARRR